MKTEGELRLRIEELRGAIRMRKHEQDMYASALARERVSEQANAIVDDEIYIQALEWVLS